MAVLAPIPSASETTATAVKVGFRRSWRSPKRRSPRPGFIVPTIPQTARGENGYWLPAHWLYVRGRGTLATGSALLCDRNRDRSRTIRPIDLHHQIALRREMKSSARYLQERDGIRHVHRDLVDVPRQTVDRAHGRGHPGAVKTIDEDVHRIVRHGAAICKSHRSHARRENGRSFPQVWQGSRANSKNHLR